MRNFNFAAPRLPRRIDLELPEGSVKRRTITVILLIVVAIVAFGFGLSGLLSRKAGWTEISARKGSPGCAQEFYLQYNVPKKRSTKVYKNLVSLYTSACERAANVFGDEAASGVTALYELNSRPNTELEIEPELYAALGQIAASGARECYLAPLYESYGGLFFCETDLETYDYDPVQNPELAAYFAELAAFASDPAQVDIELLGDNRARLKVSEEYLAYAKENSISRYFSLGWLKNAFISDYLAGVLREHGYTDGLLQSYDGYGADLCEGEVFGMYVFDCAETVAVVAQMEYAGPMSYVSLHSRALNPVYGDGYYEFESGEVRAAFVDPSDGLPKTAEDDLMLYSGTLGCAELLLRACPVFIADSFEPSALESSDFGAVYCMDKKIVCTGGEVSFPVVDEAYELIHEKS